MEVLPYNEILTNSACADDGAESNKCTSECVTLGGATEGEEDVYLTNDPPGKGRRFPEKVTCEEKSGERPGDSGRHGKRSSSGNRATARVR